MSESVYKSDQGEHAFIAAAARLILEVGPEVSVDRICREAGLSRGALYHHFPSKRDLVLRALQAEGVARDLPAGRLLRLLPYTLRDADMARALVRSTRALPAAPAATLADALAFGERVRAAFSQADDRA